MRRILITLLTAALLLGAALQTHAWEPPTLPPNPYESWTRPWVKENRVRIHCPRIGRLAERYARDLQAGTVTDNEARQALTRLSIYNEDEADDDALRAMWQLLMAAQDHPQTTPDMIAQDAYTACARAYRAKRLFDDIR